MELENLLTFTKASEWRQWLEAHHATAHIAWLVYYKAHTGHPTVAYEDTVEEALCFGWVDSIIQRIDDNTYARKFTPRTNTEKWSATNKRRVAKLMREGRMTQAGLEKLGGLTLEELEAPAPPKLPLVLEGWVEELFKTSPKAWQAFCNLPPSHQRRYIGWATDAKKEETIRRRLAEVVATLEAGKELGMK